MVESGVYDTEIVPIHVAIFSFATNLRCTQSPLSRARWRVDPVTFRVGETAKSLSDALIWLQVPRSLFIDGFPLLFLITVQLTGRDAVEIAQLFTLQPSSM